MNMNKKSIITILFALVAMAGQAQVPLESVRELTMKSEYFNHERQVLIYTPGGYQQFDQTSARCSTLFTACSTLLASPTPTVAGA